MKVAIDISPLKGMHNYRGIGTYTRELYRSLKKVDRENQYLLTTQIRQAQANIIHYPYFDLFFLTLPLIKRAPTVVTIHDVIPLVYADHYPPGLRGGIKFRIQKMSLRSVKAIITDSKQSKVDIHNYLGIPEEKIFPIYLGVSKKFYPRKKSAVNEVKSKYKLSKPYLIYVGDINYNKNLPRLIKAYAESKIEKDLVLVSRALSNDIPETRQIIDLVKKHNIKDKVHLLTEVDSKSDDLPSLYSGANWYVQPSLYEGFGLPILEAWASGIPVISSNGGSLREVVGKAALTFNPRQKEDMRMTLIKAAEMNNKGRDKLIKLGQERVKIFTWEQTARETIKVYKKVGR